MGGAWTNQGAVQAASGTILGLGDNWDDWDGYGYDYFASNDAWVNNGTITTGSASVYLGGWLSLDPSAHNLATLALGQDAAVDLIGTLDNRPADNPFTGGVLTLTPGVTSSTGSWYFDGGRIYGGMVNATAASLIDTEGGYEYVGSQDYVGVGGGVLYGVTLDGALDMSALAATLTIAGGLTLNTDLNVSGEDTRLYFDTSIAQAIGVGTLVSGATIHLSGYDADMVTTSDSLRTTSETVTLDPTITVSGESSFDEIEGGSSGDFDNQGTIEDNQSGSLLYVSDALTNFYGGTLTGGTWAVSNGGAIAVGGRRDHRQRRHDQPQRGDLANLQRLWDHPRICRLRHEHRQRHLASGRRLCPVYVGGRRKRRRRDRRQRCDLQRGKRELHAIGRDHPRGRHPHRRQLRPQWRHLGRHGLDQGQPEQRRHAVARGHPWHADGAGQLRADLGRGARHDPGRTGRLQPARDCGQRHARWDPQHVLFGRLHARH